MPISLQSTKALNNVSVGQAVYFSETEEILLNSNNMVFLKSGYCSIGESAIYPDAYGKFDNFITPIQSPFPSNIMNVTYIALSGTTSLDYANGLYIAGSNPSTGASGGLIATSPDGLAWTVVSKTRYTPNVINYLGGKYVMGGYDRMASTPSNGLYTSTDLTTWTLVASRYNTANYAMYDSVVGNGLLVTVGYFGTIVTYNGTTATTRSPGSSSSTTLFSVDFGAGRFVTPATTGINYSSDGATWTQVIPSGWASAGQTCVVFGNGVFIVSTQAGGLWWRSTDGVNWTSFSMPSSINGAYCSRYGFVFNTGATSFVTSTDGITWDTINTQLSQGATNSAASNGTDVMMAGLNSSVISSTIPTVGLLKETSTGYGKLYMRIK